MFFVSSSRWVLERSAGVGIEFSADGLGPGMHPAMGKKIEALV